MKSEKDLAVTFDEKLVFREHILPLIFKSFTYLNKEMFLCLYKILARPHLKYATTVWSPMYKKDSVTLENTQRKATKKVNSLSYFTYE